MLKILESRTHEQAVNYFNTGREQYRNITDPIMLEVYSTALEWKFKNVPFNKWSDFPIQDIAVSLILGEL